MLNIKRFSIYSLFVILASTLVGCWQQNSAENDKNAVSVKFNPITQTNYLDDEKKVYPLTLEFSASVAPIEQVGKEIKQDITITPAIQGRWEWKNDKTLTFSPKEDWPTGQEYQIKLNKNIFNPALSYAKSVTEPHTVKTPDFKAVPDTWEFHQDPNDAHIRQSIVKLNFSHPVDRPKLEKALSVNLIRKNQDQTQDIISPLNFTIRYDSKDLTAWIRSDSVNLANSDNQYIQTKIDKNVTALIGNNILEKELVTEVEVPTKFSLGVNNYIRYINNQKNEPEQLLQFEFTQSVKDTEFAKHVRAFLLPQQNERWDYSKLTQQVLDNSEEISLTLIPTSQRYDRQQNLRINIPQQRCIYVYIDNEITAQGGYQLPRPQGNIACAGKYPKYVGFVGKGSLLSLSGDKQITISARNFERIRLHVGRIHGVQLRHIANLNSGTFQTPNLGQLKFDDIADFYTKEYQLSNVNPSKSEYVSFDFNTQHSLKNRGIFWLKTEGSQDNGHFNISYNKDYSNQYDWRNDETNQYTDYRLVILTDLGIIAKKSADGSQSVFVQSIHSGEPIAGANVKVVSRNGSIIERAFTDSSGMALLPSLDNYRQELEPVMYLVEHNEDQSFLPINKEERTLDYSRFDVSGTMVEKHDDALRAYLFNDRGIYRPSETLHAGIVTKAADWKIPVGNIPLQLEITSPSGYLAMKRTLRLNANGFNTFDYHLPENAETGEWLLNLYTTAQNYQTEIGSMTFQVQEFQPDTLKIKTTFNTQQNLGWVSPQELTANVNLSNLFGTPAQKRKVTANLALHSVFPKLTGYEDYRFYDNQRNKSAILYETELNEQYTDQQGNARFPLDLSQYAENTVQMLYFTADGFETDSGRGVSNIKSVMVSAQPWLIGYQTKQDLNYVKKAQNTEIQLIAVNPNLQKTAVLNLKSTLFKLEYVSVLTQQDSGAYKYESKLIETQQEEKPLNIPSEGLTLPLNTQDSGDFVLVLSNEYNQEVNRIHYSVIGNQNLAGEMAKNTELKLKLNKKQFNPNEEIEVVIHSPYAGSGLITIERDRVYAHKWFKTNTNQSVQRIRLPNNFEGNGYINVQFSRDINSDDIFTSPLSYGVIPFSVNVDNHRLNLQLEAPKQVKSGETVQFKLTSDKTAKAVIYAVNEGILQVGGYELKDPLKFFFPKNALQVETLQILDLILPEFSKIMKFARTGGDDGESAEPAALMRMKEAANNNPFKRKTDKPVVYWSGLVEVNGEKSVDYQIPQGFNGNLKVMAFALSNDSDTIGTAQTDTLVRDDIIISPTAPLTLTPNDQSRLAVSVANNTKQTQQINVKVTSNEQIAVTDEAEKTVEVPPMSESVVSFTLKATEQVGAADIRITANYQNAQQQSATTMRNISVSVRPTQPKQHFTRIGKVEAGKQVNANLPTLLYPQQRKQSALFSPAPLALTQGISVYLADYDNYCTEQVISSAMPNILVAGNPEYQKILTALSRGRDKTDPFIATKALKKVFEILPTRQMGSGEFGVWNNISDADLFVTAYVAHFLIEAQDHHMRLPRTWTEEQGLLPKVITALEYQSEPQEGDSLLMLRQRAYSAYLLTRLAQVPSNSLISIRSQLEQNFKATDWQKDLTAAWLAGAYQNLKQQDLADQLIAPITAELSKPRTAQWRYEYYHDPLIQDASVLYIIARHFPERLATLADPVLNRITEDLNGARYNTLSSAMILLALDAYAQQHQTEAEQLQLTLNGTIVDDLQGALRFTDVNEDKADLTFTNQSQQTAWFAVSQSGYPQQAPQTVVKNGLEIDRTYTDKDGKPVQTVKIGDVINVTVNLRSGKGYLSDIITTDLFPAGFEVIWKNPSEEQEDSENIDEKAFWSPMHTDLREDRMLSYGSIDENVSTLKYQLKAVNEGTFHIPAVYAESMYDRTIHALSSGQGSIKVEK